LWSFSLHSFCSTQTQSVTHAALLSGNWLCLGSVPLFVLGDWLLIFLNFSFLFCVIKMFLGRLLGLRTLCPLGVRSPHLGIARSSINAFFHTGAKSRMSYFMDSTMGSPVPYSAARPAVAVSASLFPASLTHPSFCSLLLPVP
jgi:hypothetical protein